MKKFPIKLLLSIILALSACGGGDDGPGICTDIISGPSGPGPDDLMHDRPFGSLAIHPTNPDLVFVGTEANGFVKTTDGGTTWTRHREGLKHPCGMSYPEIYDIAFAPSNPNVLYAATVDSPGSPSGNYSPAAAGIYKSVDGGNSWHQTNNGLSNSSTPSVLVHPDNENFVLIGVSGGYSSITEFSGQYFEGGIFYSTNGGNHWLPSNIGGSDTTNQYWQLIRRQGLIYTFGRDQDNPSKNVGFLYSADWGINWSPFGADLKNSHISYFDIASDQQVLYVGEWNPFQARKSKDGGDSWTTYPFSPGPITVSPFVPDTLVYSVGVNLYYSDTGWDGPSTLVATAAEFFDDIVFAPSDPNIVYAIARGYEFFRSDDGGMSFTLMKNIRSEVLNVIP